MIPAVHQQDLVPTELAVQCEPPVRSSMQLVRPRSARRALWPSVPREPYRSRTLEALEEAERAIMTPDRSTLTSTAAPPDATAPEFPQTGQGGKHKVAPFSTSLLLLPSSHVIFRLLFLYAEGRRD